VPVRRWATAGLREHVDHIDQTAADPAVQEERDVIAAGNDVDWSLAHRQR
jgi:hypothetical protein